MDTEILQGVTLDINAAFGGNLNFTQLDTPQGQLASTLTAIIQDQNDQFLLLTQNVDPSYSSGRMQDAIGRIYFLPRYPARATVVQATCRGLQGVVIPVGALARAIDGNYYTADQQGTIGADGTVTLPFSCGATGPIPCATGALNQVYQVIPGWDSIINNSDGEVGIDVESRAAYEQRRFNSVAGNSVGMLASVQGAVMNVPGILDSYTTENFSNVGIVQDGVMLPPHSLYVCTVGGDSIAIAQAIFTRKSPGCAMAGNTTIQVQDLNGGYSPPYPTYAITFQIANPLTFVVLVTLSNTVQVPSDVQVQVQTAIMNAWDGQDGGPRARIGSVVFASRYYAAVASLGSWAQIISIKLGVHTNPAANITASITGSALNVTFTDGILLVGQTIRGAGIPDGVQITAMTPGANGGVGVYNLNTSFAPPGIPLQNMVAIYPGSDDVAVGIAHYPALSTANITVQLASL